MCRWSLNLLHLLLHVIYRLFLNFLFIFGCCCPSVPSKFCDVRASALYDCLLQWHTAEIISVFFPPKVKAPLLGCARAAKLSRFLIFWDLCISMCRNPKSACVGMKKTTFILKMKQTAGIIWLKLVSISHRFQFDIIIIPIMFYIIARKNIMICEGFFLQISLFMYKKGHLTILWQQHRDWL